MEHITVASPSMAVLSQDQLQLSPFGALAQTFAEEIWARARLEEGRYPYVPLELLEEGEQVPMSQAPAPVVQLDLHLILEALKKDQGQSEQVRAAERIVERILLIRADREKRTKQAGGKLTERSGMLRQNLTQKLRQEIRFPSGLGKEAGKKGRQALDLAVYGGSGQQPPAFFRPILPLQQTEGNQIGRIMGRTGQRRNSTGETDARGISPISPEHMFRFEEHTRAYPPEKISFQAVNPSLQQGWINEEGIRSSFASDAVRSLGTFSPLSWMESAGQKGDLVGDFPGEKRRQEEKARIISSAAYRRGAEGRRSPGVSAQEIHMAADQRVEAVPLPPKQLERVFGFHHRSSIPTEALYWRGGERTDAEREAANSDSALQQRGAGWTKEASLHRSAGEIRPTDPPGADRMGRKMPKGGKKPGLVHSLTSGWSPKELNGTGKAAVERRHSSIEAASGGKSGELGRVSLPGKHGHRAVEEQATFGAEARNPESVQAVPDTLGSFHRPEDREKRVLPAVRDVRIGQCQYRVSKGAFPQAGKWAEAAIKLPLSGEKIYKTGAKEARSQPAGTQAAKYQLLSRGQDGFPRGRRDPDALDRYQESASTVWGRQTGCLPVGPKRPGYRLSQSNPVLRSMPKRTIGRAEQGEKVSPVEPAAGQRFRHMEAELAPLQLAYLTEPEGALLLQNAAAPTAVTERRARQEVEWEHQAPRQRFMFSWDSKKERKTEGGLELPNRRLYRKEPTAFPTMGVIQTETGIHSGAPLVLQHGGVTSLEKEEAPGEEKLTAWDIRVGKRKNWTSGRALEINSSKDARIRQGTEKEMGQGRADWTPGPARVELTHSRPRMEPPKESVQVQAPEESDYVRSLPDWARRFLRESSKQGASEREMGMTGKRTSLPEQGERVQWTAPGYRPSPAPLAYREKKESDRPKREPEHHISDAELQRTADRVYHMIEERIRRERRRLGF